MAGCLRNSGALVSLLFSVAFYLPCAHVLLCLQLWALYDFDNFLFSYRIWFFFPVSPLRAADGVGFVGQADVHL